MKRFLTILSLLIFNGAIFSEAQQYQPVGFWKMYYWDGELRATGFMRSQTINRKSFYEKQDNKSILGGILLRTKNYVWHPRFMTIDIDGAYSPSFEDEKYLAIPDRTENRDLKRMDIRMSILSQNKISNYSYFNYGSFYNNRENLSNLKSNVINWGSTVFYRAKKIPFSIGYSSLNQDDKEVQTGRTFQYKLYDFEGRANTSFVKKDKQELIISHKEYFRKEYSNAEILNRINNLQYNSQVPFGKKRYNYFNSFLSGIFQRGKDNFDRYQAMEHVNTQLNRDLRMGTYYNYFYEKRPTQTLRQDKAGINFSHQLYKSLHTTIGYDYIINKSSYYSDRTHMVTGDISYIKKILRKHSIELAYQFNFSPHSWKSADTKIDIFSEPVTLVDGQITLLSKPNVIMNTIVVKDITSTIIYRLNLDYLLIPQNDYVQIQRIPGGLIPNNFTVYVDYSSLQPGNYQYTGVFRQASAAMYFFKQMFGIYYRHSVQDYHNLKNTAFVTLNYMDRNVVGFKFDKKFVSVGIEYDNMKSTVLPYELYRYYFIAQRSINKKLIVSLNGDVYDYKKMNGVKNIQYIDASGSAVWQTTPRMSFTGSAFYRKQQGEGNHLDLFYSTAEFRLVIKKLIFSVGYNYYDRSLFDERIKFNAIGFQLIRKF